MIALSGQLIHTALPAIIAVVVVWLGRHSQKQFTIGSIAVLIIAIAVSLYKPNIVVYRGPEWVSGYSTWATAVATLYAIAQIAIWRGFAKPSWLALLTTLIPVLAIGSMGGWQS